MRELLSTVSIGRRWNHLHCSIVPQSTSLLFFDRAAVTSDVFTFFVTPTGHMCSSKPRHSDTDSLAHFHFSRLPLSFHCIIFLSRRRTLTTSNKSYKRFAKKQIPTTKH
jgi:hypothetical protein